MTQQEEITLHDVLAQITEIRMSLRSAHRAVDAADQARKSGLSEIRSDLNDVKGRVYEQATTLVRVENKVQDVEATLSRLLGLETKGNGHVLRLGMAIIGVNVLIAALIGIGFWWR